MTNKEMYNFAKKINPNNEQGWTLAFSDVYGDFLIVEKVDEMNVFNDDVEASIVASKAGIPFIGDDFLYVDTEENRNLLIACKTRTGRLRQKPIFQ